MDRYENINVLVVDDLPDKLLVYRTILEELGVNIVTARSGPEALKLVLQHEFAVILLDVNMPDMDGFETAALIHSRKRSAHTPIIFVTAYMDEFHTAQGYAQGAVDYILTPVVPEILRTKVKVFVDLFRMTEQVRMQAEERIALAEEHARRIAAEEAGRRSAFLSEVSAALMGSMELDSRVGDLVRLPLPLLADVGIARLVDHAGDEIQTHWAWFDPRRGTAVDQPADRARFNPLLLAALKRTLESGQTEILPPQEIPLAASVEAAPPSAEPEPSGPPRKLRHVGVFPMVARGKTVGAVLLARAGERPPFDRDDCRLAEELALRGAIAIDNIGLYRSIREADRRKDEFLAMLAHELRNPLAPISNAVEIMRLRGPGHPELDWARDVIARQVQHLVRLVDDLLDVSRITRGKIRLKLEPIDLAAVVSNAVETSRPLIEGRRHRFVVDIPAESIWVKADPARLAQVLANLLNNAAKYTEEGGSIRLSVAREGGQAAVRVRDSGVGIPSEMLSGIFDLFTQVDRSLDRSQGGLGIG
ncbi:MAG: response regulator, partial [Thermoguttaceae bacterium]|nr:response regulator [Thermoguttaceae bacterium]